MKKMTRTQKNILILMSLVVLCLFALVVALIPVALIPSTSPLPSSPDPTSTPGLTIPTPLQHKKFMAQIKCERFIKDRLVSPSSAKFSHEQSYKVNSKPPNYHAVTGVVESQNRLGVPLRSAYRCDLHYLPNDPMTWVLDYLDIGD